MISANAFITPVEDTGVFGGRTKHQKKAAAKSCYLFPPITPKKEKGI
jgi:hypothetical protein